MCWEEIAHDWIQVKLSLCLIKHNAINTDGGEEVQLHAFLSSALDRGKWSASLPGRFTPGSTYPLRRLGVPQSRSRNALAGTRIMVPLGRSASSVVAIPTELSRLSGLDTKDEFCARDLGLW
jgi:hypothetical protein